MECKDPVLGVIGGILLLFGGIVIAYTPVKFLVTGSPIEMTSPIIGLVTTAVIILSGVGVLLRVASVRAHRQPDLSTVAGGTGIAFSLLSVLSVAGSGVGGQLFALIGGLLAVVWHPSTGEGTPLGSMSRRRRVTARLVIVGLLLVTNPIWLLPHEGETRFTYQRAPLVIDNGNISYKVTEMVLTDEMKNEFKVDRGEEGVNNGTVEYKGIDRYTRIADIGYDFAHIACENHDPDSRACAFDAYLVTDGPIEIKHQGSYDTDHDFVYHDEKYYRRIDRYHEANDSITFDVERIRPRKLLAEMARNISTEESEVNRGIFSHWHHRLLVTGAAETSYISPTADESWRVRARENIGIDAFDPVHEKIIGNVYRYNETYYTVIVSEDTIDRPGISPWSRLLLVLTGLSILIYRL